MLNVETLSTLRTLKITIQIKTVTLFKGNQTYIIA